MQPVTPRTTTGTARPASGRLCGRGGRGRLLVVDLPRDQVGQDLLDRDPGRLAGLHLDPRLGPVLELLGPLRGHGDEAELALGALPPAQAAPPSPLPPSSIPTSP